MFFTNIGKYPKRFIEELVRQEKGFTLLELLIALVILLVIAGVFFTLLRSSTQTITLTSNSFAAITIGSKVITDLNEESNVEGTLIETTQEFPELKTQDSVIEAQSIYYRYLKDSKPPWGTIDPAIEKGLNQEFGTAFDQLKPFKLQVSFNRLADENSSTPQKHIAEAVIRIDWAEKDGQKRCYTIKTDLLSPVGAMPSEKIAMKKDVLEQKIRETFFPDLAGKSLDQAITETGCDRDMLLEIGKVGVYTSELLAGLATITSDINDLVKLRKPLIKDPSYKLAEIQMEIARKTECGASLIYKILLEASESLQKVKDSATSSNIGSIPQAPYVSGLKTFEIVSGEIIKWIKNTQQEYEYLLQEGFSPYLLGREKIYIKSKTLDAKRLLVALGKIPLDKWKTLVQQEKEKVSGRNPFYERLFLHEEKIAAQNIETIKTSYPNLTKVVDDLDNKIWKLAKEVPGLIALHGGT